MVKGKNWRLMIALLAVLALLGAACGGDDDPKPEDTGGGRTRPRSSRPARRWPSSRRRARSTSASSTTYPRSASRTRRRVRSKASTSTWATTSRDKLGVEAEFVEAISDNRIPFLQDGTVDLILSTMTITTDRDAEIDFSRPYFIANGRILVPEDSDIAGIEDLAGKKVCTALGSTYESTIKEQAPEADLKTVEAYSDCLTLIQNGQVDAVSTDNVILTGMVIQSGDDFPLKIVGDDLTTEPYGAGLTRTGTRSSGASSTRRSRPRSRTAPGSRSTTSGSVSTSRASPSIRRSYTLRGRSRAVPLRRVLLEMT